jgi:predicted nucleic acid-binding Zn ribbon protein
MKRARSPRSDSTSYASQPTKQANESLTAPWPVVQELKELAEVHRVVDGHREVHCRCPAAWRTAVTRRRAALADAQDLPLGG